MTRQLSAPTPSVRRLNIVAAVAKGGTSADNSVDAATQLGAVNLSTIGVANGPAKVQAGGLIDVNNLPAAFPKGPTLDGPSDFYIGAVHTLTITNYDVASDASYTTSVTAGTVSRSGATITFTAPGTIQTVTLTVAGRAMQINVKNTAPITPSIVAPVNYATNQSSVVYITGSAFALPTGTPSHQFSDWEIALDINFTNVVAQSFNDTVNKTSWTAPTLSAATQYYVRTRYKDTVQGYSQWSNPSTFTTKASFTISTEEAKLVSTDIASGDNFGQSVAVSGDGTRVVVGAHAKNSSTGAAYVFLRNANGTWTQEQKIVPNDPTSGSAFGYSVMISIDATRIVVAAPSKTVTVSSQGCVYVFSRSGTTWTQEQRIVASDPATGDDFGISASFSTDMTRMAVGADLKTGSVSSQGAVYVFTRSGTVWSQEQKLLIADPLASDKFGFSVSLDATGTRFVAGAQGKATSAGAAYIFLRSGVTWAQEAKLLPADPTNNSFFGYAVASNSDCTRCVIGAYAKTVTQSTQGAAYIFNRNTTTNVWTQEQRLVATDAAAADSFGYSVAIQADGVRAFIGARTKSGVSGVNQGAAYMFLRNTGTNVWAQENKLSASDNAAGGRYGHSGWFADSGNRVVIGANNADSQGAAYVYG